MGNFTEDSIKEKLKKIIAKELKIESEDITDDSHIEDDIGVESAEMINLLYNIETEFNIEISNEEASKNLIIQKMANLVKEKINVKSAKWNYLIQCFSHINSKRQDFTMILRDFLWTVLAV